MAGQAHSIRAAISIHALREEGDSGYRLALNRLLISIHALREEGDPDALQKVVQRDDFYPRPPRGGRRVTINGCIIRLYFYPRPPRGGRHLRFRHSNRPSRFLSTPSARRATDRRTQGPAGCRKFLSTPSARRATAGVMSLIFKSWKFLSTPSARRATWLSSLSARRWRISIHALREEGDLGGKAPITAYTDISIHALREEGDHKTIQYQPDGENFYPRPPRGGRPDWLYRNRHLR